MPKIERKTQKIFGGNADSDQLAVFGTMITGTPVYNDDIETLQSEAYTEGWQAAVAANEAPFMEEMNGVQYGFSKQLAYLFQQGIAEWDSGTTYYLNSFCQVGGVIYKSMQDENINHSPADDTEGTYWSPLETGGGGSSGLEVCDIGMALYIDETKGLRRRLNGTILDINTNTQAFLNRLLQIQTTNPEYFTTEDNWQAEALLNIDGCVYKFVLNYASDGETVVSVRLPKYPDYVEINAGGTLPVVGNGTSLGLTNSVVNVAPFTSPSYGLYFGTQGFGKSVGTNSNELQGQQPLSLGVTTDPEKSGLEATLNQTKLKLRYFIQIATGQETEVNITNEIELNNPFFFGMSQYFDVEPNNLSWLKSSGQWNSKAVYPDYYNWLLQEKNNPSTLPASEANVDIAGSLINNNGVLSGFSESNYALVPDIPSNIESLEIVFKYTTTDDVTTRQSVYGQNIVNETTPQLTIGHDNGLSQSLLSLGANNWGTGVYTLETPVANTTYTAKTTWDNVSKTHKFFLAVNNGDFVEQGSVSQETVYWVEQLKIGLDINAYPWFGSIDLNGCYININGSRWWSGMTNGVKFSTEDYSDYDYVINTSDETFRLPLKNGMESVFIKQAPVVGNGQALGLTTNPTGAATYMLNSYNSPNYGAAYGNYSSGNLPKATGVADVTHQQVMGVTTDSNTSGLVADLSTVTVPSNYSLYYYVGETVQNANLIDAGRIGEQLADKVDKNELTPLKKAYITETYVNGTSWYRVWSDGWCEQGGLVSVNRNSQTTVQLLKAYPTTTYHILTNIRDNTPSGAQCNKGCVSTTSSILVAYSYVNEGTSPANIDWETKGYIS